MPRLERARPSVQQSSGPSSRPSARENRRILIGRSVWLGLGLLVGGIVSHFGYWYVPRLRPTPSAGSRLLEVMPDRDLVLWMPFPHQNLAALSEWVENPQTFLAALTRLAGGKSASMPSLGPFGLPPASELALAFDADGANPVLGIRPYPIVRLLARTAGWLADNPWLAGGRVETGEGALVVEWSDGVWWVSPGGLESSPAGRQSSQAGTSGGVKALAHVAIKTSVLEFPNGGYDLYQRAGQLVLGKSVAPAVGRPAGSPLLEIRDLSIFRLVASGEQLMVFAGEPRSGELPSAVAIGRDRDRAFAALPGARILGRVSELPTLTGDDWVLVATDQRGLALALESESLWATMVESALDGEESGFWVRLDSAESLASGLADLLEDFPLVSPARAQRWRDIQTVLAGLRRFHVASAGWSSKDAWATLE